MQTIENQRGCIFSGGNLELNVNFGTEIGVALIQIESSFNPKELGKAKDPNEKNRDILI